MNTAVALIFFNRPDTLRRVFDIIRMVKPPRLFLIQDGPRENYPADIELINECREIVSEIDWRCEIKKNYSETNLGCGMRPQTGISWVLSQVESAIILEDDCVPEITFFAYCEELLKRYENDDRICYISGLNHFEEWPFNGKSYGFAMGGAIWGWATWRRAWKNYDYSVSGIKDKYIEEILLKKYKNIKGRIKLWKKTNDAVQSKLRLSYWDIQWGFVKYAQSQMVIIPKYNLIKNIGTGINSTHSQNDVGEHRKYYDYNNMPTKALEFPLMHPEFIICDSEYDSLLNKCNGRAKQRILIKAIARKIRKILNGDIA